MSKFSCDYYIVCNLRAKKLRHRLIIDANVRLMLSGVVSDVFLSVTSHREGHCGCGWDPVCAGDEV